MPTNEKRLTDLEKDVEKTTPEKDFLIVYWYEDRPLYVSFVPPGQDRSVEMLKEDFEKQYSETDRQVIEVCYVTRPDNIQLHWTDDDSPPED